MCEVATQEFNQGLGCNTYGPAGGIEFTPASPKKSGFLGFRKNSPKSSPKNKSRKSKELKDSKDNSWNIFGKKSSDSKRMQEIDRTAELVAQLKLEGRSDADIAMHLQYINDVQVAPPVSPKKSKSGISKFFQMLKDELSLTQVVYVLDESTFKGMTISISTAPFYGAPPPDMDISLEELAKLQPLYATGSVNNLPVHKHDGTPLPGNQTNCPVCLCDFEHGEQLKSLPACVHFYHGECIDRWLMVGHSCPLCKTVVE